MLLLERKQCNWVRERIVQCHLKSGVTNGRNTKDLYSNNSKTGGSNVFSSSLFFFF